MPDMLPCYRSANISAQHGFFTRNGGISSGCYDSLNVAFGSLDDEVCVRENRMRIATTLGADTTKLFTCSQVHSARCITLTTDSNASSYPEADAMVSNIKGHILGILTADCVPVLLYDAHANVSGAAHAGWKGALAGIIPSTINAMTTLGATPDNIIAAIGPSIMQASYEVGSEFKERFCDSNTYFSRYFIASPAQEDTHFLYDNRCFVRDRLYEHGVKHVDLLHHDTYQLEHIFFSYRRATHRAESDYGRQLSAIKC